MKHDFVVKLRDTSISEMELTKNQRDNFRDIFKIWLDEFIDIFTNLKLIIREIDVFIHCDWSEFIKDLKWSYDNNLLLSDVQDEYNLFKSVHGDMEFTLDDFFKLRFEENDNSNLSFSGTINHNNESYETVDYLRIIIFHIWRSSNLSFPGAFCLHNAEILISGEDSSYLSLPSYSLGSIYSSEYNNCYCIRPISLKKTWIWYCNVVDISSLVTTNNFDRAISGLFNYQRHDSFIQSDIINLFLGAEAFYDLNSRGVKETLKFRAIDFLNIQKDKKFFSKGLSDFYDYRSRYVHGDLDIISYMDILQNFLVDIPEYEKYYSVCQFGVFFILASIQNAIEKDCIALSYREIKDMKKI
ncbi:hypothetical protein [Fusibacter bizertensis]